MDIKIIISTFFVIFLAELGDKTQFAAMAASAGSSQPVSVLTGTILALSLSSVIAVAAGSLLGKYIPIKYIKIAAGALFIIFGILYLREAFVPEKTTHKPESSVIGYVGKSVIKTAAAFERNEIEMFRAAAEVLDDQQYLDVINRIIDEEENHLKSFSNIGEQDFKIESTTPDELKHLETLDESFYCSEEADCLLKDLYDREKSMAEFYRIASEKTPIESVRKALRTLSDEENNHAKKIAALLV